MMTLQAMGWFFVAMSLLNIPLYVLYSGTDIYSAVTSTTSNATVSKSSSTSEFFFFSLSLGNIGESGGHCSSINLASSETKI